MQRCLLTEPEAEAQQKVRSKIRDLVEEAETGVPALTRLYMSADGS